MDEPEPIPLPGIPPAVDRGPGPPRTGLRHRPLPSALISTTDPPDAPFRTLGDLHEAAMAALPPAVRAYVDGGAGDEATLRANRQAFRRWALRPRLLAGIREVDLTATLLGRAVSAPVFVSPMAYQASVQEEGERATARAAAGEGMLAVFSTLSSFSLEEIARVAPDAPRWFQLYLQPEMDQNRALVERAERAGFGAIVLTVDVPLLGVRDSQARYGFAVASTPTVGNGPDVRTPERPRDFSARSFRLRADATHGWEVLEELRSWTGVPVVVKGVLTPEDARAAVSRGARGIVVSNHGGRQLDGAPASLEALPSIVEAVGSRAEVYLDSGVRRGSDVVMALALGARGVGVGRPVLWALAADGEAGVRRYLGLLREELAVTLALLGRARVEELDRSVLAPTESGRA